MIEGNRKITKEGMKGRVTKIYKLTRERDLLAAIRVKMRL